jgi:hypothetical protein
LQMIINHLLGKETVEMVFETTSKFNVVSQQKRIFSDLLRADKSKGSIPPLVYPSGMQLNSSSSQSFNSLLPGDNSQLETGNQVVNNPVTKPLLKKKAATKTKSKPTASKPTSEVSQKTSVVKSKKRKIVPTSDSEDNTTLAQRFKQSREEVPIVTEAIDSEVPILEELVAEVPIETEAHISAPEPTLMSEEPRGSNKAEFSSTQVTHTQEQIPSPVQQAIDDVLQDIELDFTADDEDTEVRKRMVSSSEDSDSSDEENDNDNNGAGGVHMEVGESEQSVDAEELVVLSGKGEVSIGDIMEDVVMQPHADRSTAIVQFEAENPYEGIVETGPSAIDTRGAATQVSLSSEGES